MNPSWLREILAVLRESGAHRAKLIDPNYGTLEVEFSVAATEESAGGGLTLVDGDGKPADLDEGMPELARDPIRAANYPTPERS